MRWIRFTADGRTAYGSLNGDTVSEISGEPWGTHAATGKPLWHFQAGASVYSSPMAYAVDGKEYIAVAAGSALFTFGLP